MISVIVNYIKEQSKLLYSIAAIGVIIYFIYSQWSDIKHNWFLLTPIIKIILVHLPSILLILTLVFLTISLFKISNRKSNKKMNEYLKSQKIEIETDTFRKSIGAVVIKGYDFFEGVETETIKIKVINKQESLIQFIDGYISFYYKKERVKVIPIEIKQLYKGYSERVYYHKIDKDTINWDFYEFFIAKMKIDDQLYTNLRLRSSNICQTNYFILNIDKFIDNKILGIKTKYNLVWLKKKIRGGFSLIRFFCSQKEYRIENGKVHKDFWKTIYRLLKNLLVYGIFGILFLLLIMSLLDIINMFKEIITIFIRK